MTKIARRLRCIVVPSIAARGWGLGRLIVLATVIVAQPAIAGVVAPPAAIWNQGTAPFISLFTCDNQLQTQFPNTVNDIKRELIIAAEEWFVGSGAHIRLAYLGSLTPTDPACAAVPTVIAPRLAGTPPAGPAPQRWGVVLTAAPDMTNQLTLPGIDRCHFAVTDRWELPAPAGGLLTTRTIERARITLVRGHVCNGAWERWGWYDPGVFQPATTSLSYGVVLRKMLGHALGLAEETGGSDTVMAPIDAAGLTPQNHLNLSYVTEPIVSVMRAAYGRARLRPYWMETRDNGASWSAISNTPRATADNSLGLAGCSWHSPQVGGVGYLIAETRMLANGSSKVETYVVDRTRRSFKNVVSHGASNRQPTLVCSKNLAILGWVSPNGDVVISRSTDGVQWDRARISMPERSWLAPTLARASWAQAVIAVTSGGVEPDPQYPATWRRAQTLLSLDDGVTFESDGVVFGREPYAVLYGLTCLNARKRCYDMTTTSGGKAIIDLAAMPRVRMVQWAGGGEIPNVGAALAPSFDERGYLYVRRYRPGAAFFGTPNADLNSIGGGLQSDAEATRWQFFPHAFSRNGSNTPTTVFRDDARRSFVALGAVNRIYNGFLLVPVTR